MSGTHAQAMTFFQVVRTVDLSSLFPWRYAMPLPHRLVGKNGRSRPFRVRLLVQILEDRFLPSFLPAVDYPVSASPRAVVVGDFNQDGTPDLAVANEDAGTVSILLGNGDGSFQAPQDFAAGAAHPDALAMGDFNGDGIPDLAVASSEGGVSILLGNGDGSFQTPVNYATGGSPTSVAVGDFTGNGILDLAVANGYASGVSVLLGNGDGSFQAPQRYAAGYDPAAVAVGAFNGDGIPDLAVANIFYVQGVNILLGNGDGTFVPEPGAYDTQGWHWSVAVGDFNGDGIADLAVPNGGGNSVTLLQGRGDGTFEATSGVVVGSSPRSVAVADFNGDGIQDLAMANYGSGTVSVALGYGNGMFRSAVSYAVGTYPVSVAVGDFNGDGFPDLVVANYASDTVSVLLNVPDPGSAPAARSQVRSSAPSQVLPDPLSARLASSDSGAPAQHPLAATDLQAEPVPQPAADTDGGHAGAPQPESNPPLLVPAPQAADVSFGPWTDPLVMSVLWPGS
jgi:hypothetical protein